MAESWPKSEKDYDLLEQIGHGATSIVYRARRKSDGLSCAVKTFELADDTLPDNFEERAQKEIAMLFALDHPYIIKLWATFIVGSQLWMVMPLVSGGSLKDLMQYAHPRGFPEECVVAFLRQVLEALAYLHGRDQIHRDIKAGNLFLNSEGVCLLGDFGVAAQLIEAGQDVEGRKTFAGTPCWMAPEVMKQAEGYTTSADIWSLGITAIELATGHAPYSDMHPMKVVVEVLQNDPPNLDKGNFSRNFQKLVRMCLKKDPSKRATAAELLKESIIKRAPKPEFVKKTILNKVPPIWERQSKAPKKSGHKLVKQGSDNVNRFSNKFKTGNFGQLAAQVEKEVVITKKNSVPVEVPMEKKPTLDFVVESMEETINSSSPTKAVSVSSVVPPAAASTDVAAAANRKRLEAEAAAKAAAAEKKRQMAEASAKAAEADKKRLEAETSKAKIASFKAMAEAMDAKQIK